MDKNYIFSTLFATMSCTTVALGTNVYNPQFESFCPIQMADIPYITAIDTLMQCFKNLAKDLDDAHLLKKGCREKAQQLIEDKLSSWFTGICDYLQRVFSTLILT